MGERYQPNIRFNRWSPNYSEREGAQPTLIVIHATISPNRPGLSDLEAVGEWFSRSSTQASSHICIDNEGNSCRFVWPWFKAWHCSAYNRVSLGIEQVLPDTSGREVTKEMYKECARWCARYSKKYGIPLQMGQVYNGTVTRPGIIRHSTLGVLGGGHSDPGNYDFNNLIKLAKFYRSKLG